MSLWQGAPPGAVKGVLLFVTYYHWFDHFWREKEACKRGPFQIFRDLRVVFCWGQARPLPTVTHSDITWCRKVTNYKDTVYPSIRRQTVTTYSTDKVLWVGKEGYSPTSLHFQAWKILGDPDFMLKFCHIREAKRLSQYGTVSCTSLLFLAFSKVPSVYHEHLCHLQADSAVQSLGSSEMTTASWAGQCCFEQQLCFDFWRLLE